MHSVRCFNLVSFANRNPTPESSSHTKWPQLKESTVEFFSIGVNSEVKTNYQDEWSGPGRELVEEAPTTTESSNANSLKLSLFTVLVFTLGIIFM